MAQEQCDSADLLDTRVNESQAEAELDDGPEAEITNLQENLTVSTTKIQDLEHEGKSETELKQVPQQIQYVLETSEKSEQPLDQHPKDGEEVELISDTEVISDEKSQIPQLDNLVDENIEAACEEVSGESLLKENTTSTESVNDTESEPDMSAAAANLQTLADDGDVALITSTTSDSPPDRSSYDDTNSPPFAGDVDVEVAVTSTAGDSPLDRSNSDDANSVPLADEEVIAVTTSSDLPPDHRSNSDDAASIPLADEGEVVIATPTSSLSPSDRSNSNDANLLPLAEEDEVAETTCSYSPPDRSNSDDTLLPPLDDEVQDPQKTLVTIESGEESEQPEQPLDEHHGEREEAVWVRDTEIIENLTSSEEQPHTPQPDQHVDEKLEATSEEEAEEKVDTENATLPVSVNDIESECDLSTSSHSPSERSNSHESNSRHLAEGEDENSNPLINFFQQEWEPMGDIEKPIVSVSSVENPTSMLSVVSPAPQQGELPPQSSYEPAPRGENQEATQQVLGQDSPPLSTVAMELDSKGGAASQGSGCVVNVSGAEERIEGETEQTGGKEEQKAEEHAADSVQTQKQETEAFFYVFSKPVRPTRMENDSYDDSQSDSGVSADFSPRSSMETQANSTIGSLTKSNYETPIEKEIRRAIEREQSLRRSRGLPTPPSTHEYVEIPIKKNILPMSPPANPERNMGKDRQFAGKKMQQEIHEEAQREQDLVKLGKVPGGYDKGTVRQLKEKKQLFEAFQEPKDPPTAISTRNKTPFSVSGGERPNFYKQRGTLPQATAVRSSYMERRESVDMQRQTPSPNSPKGGRSNYNQNVIPENNLRAPSQKFYQTRPEAAGTMEVDSGMPRGSTTVNGTYRNTGRQHEKEEEDPPKENPFFKLRPSSSVIKVEQDIRETQEREKELRKQRISLYGGSGVGNGRGGGRVVSTDRNSPTWNEEALPDLPAPISRGKSGAASVRQSLGKLGMWPPDQAEQEQRGRPEIQVSPRTRRQKPPLLQRWETSLVKGHNDDD